MWTVIHITASRAVADKVVALLKEDGILATIKRNEPLASEGFYEILVLKREAIEAQEVIRLHQVQRVAPRGDGI